MRKLDVYCTNYFITTSKSAIMLFDCVQQVKPVTYVFYHRHSMYIEILRE